MNDLSQKKCIPCSGDAEPLKSEELLKLMEEINKRWELQENRKLFCSVKTKDFKTSLNLANEIGRMADEEWHHPDLKVCFGRIDIEIWTHKIDALVESDFIFASKVDKILAHNNL